MTFEQTELKIIRWAEARKIIPNSTPQTQLLKTVEELGELVGAVLRNNQVGIKDGLGDVMVTLVIAADLLGTNVRECMELAYNEIKDRRGTMMPSGVFVREE
jgi:NTP pyrophosphatase (non-canonical NTP hydrolase)